MFIPAEKTVEIGNVIVGDEPKICASLKIQNETSLKLLEKIGNADLLEARIDYLSRNHQQLMKNLQQLTDKPVIVTNRKKDDGGHFDGTETERIQVLTSVIDNADAVDIELSTTPDAQKTILEEASEQGIPTIISHHNFSQTPNAARIMKTLSQALAIGQIAKVAYTINNQKDLLNLFTATLTVKKKEKHPLISIPMGVAGVRAFSVLFGTDILYAAISPEEKTGPGQLTIQQAKTLLKLLEESK